MNTCNEGYSAAIAAVTASADTWRASLKAVIIVAGIGE
jgi:hypothetical protein